MKFGELLRNGAKIIDARGEYVLAFFNGEYVTWRCDSADKREVGNGHYFGNDIAKAAENYQQRCAEAYGPRLRHVENW